MAPRSALLVLAILAASVALPGCLSLDAAAVPERLLEGRHGNGWQKNATLSMAQPHSAEGGTFKSQTFVYEDRTSERGHPGSLTVTTIRTLLRPSEDGVRETMLEQVREQARVKGIRILGEPEKGDRTLRDGSETVWFVYQGSVDQPGFFARNARVKIVGEVWQCVGHKTVVVAVGLAQVTDVRTVGGVPLPSEEDDTTWREIVADPRGKIEGVRGSNGLLHNIEC